MRMISLLLSGALFISTAHAAPAVKPTDTTQAPPRSPAPAAPIKNDNVQAAIAGKISDVRGAPQIVRKGKTIQAEANQDLWEGDRIVTDQASRLKATMADETRLFIGSKSSLTIDRYAYSPESLTRTAKLRASFGVFRVWVTKAVKKNSSFDVITSTAVAGVRGTHFMGIVSETTSSIASIEGRVAVRSANEEIEGEVTLLDGQGTDVGAGANPSVPVTWGNSRFYQLFQETE